MSNKLNEKENEVTVIRSKTSLDYSEYVSISLKSATVSVDSLIAKALESTSIPEFQKRQNLDAIS